jgi:hypothetical protein
MASISTTEKTRFDLENDISDCWTIIRTLEQMQEEVENLNDPADADKMSNMILGLTTIYEMKFARLWETFEELVHTGKC